MKKYYKYTTFGLGIIAVFILIIILTNNNNTNEFLEKYSLENKSVEEIIYELDSNIQNYGNLNARVTGTKLLLSDFTNEESIKLPKDKFYLSFAPYINYSHECLIHNLISCRSELINEVFNVRIIDITGNVILDEELTSFDNGFVGIWLPKNLKATLDITYNDLSVKANIETFEGSNTCLTSPLKLG